MKFIGDLHTHTIVSGHAYTTLLENVKCAKENGIKILGTSEHGPNMPGGPHLFYFGNIETIPREIDGLTILRGCEANIINFEGKIDLPSRIQNSLDYIIASLHDVCINPGTIEENTNAYLRVMENPNVKILGHIGNSSFPINKEEVIKKAKEKNILIEINNGSFFSRPNSIENCIEICSLCKKHEVKIILGSDSHIGFNIGKFDKAEQILKECNFPLDLIINCDETKLLNFILNTKS